MLLKYSRIKSAFHPRKSVARTSINGIEFETLTSRVS